MTAPPEPIEVVAELAELRDLIKAAYAPHTPNVFADKCAACRAEAALRQRAKQLRGQG